LRVGGFGLDGVLLGRAQSHQTGPQSRFSHPTLCRRRDGWNVRT
jgi:hypothetical protein